ncbi:substrate-binding region of ABC-type glycine betaine transport system [Arthrobacter crystallopoietes BAB-32]|uniref:Substrate-binding region of ABC-type glycine betaine transport system n=1 Tax=Arthrobacter crystallopoietes BAB-32 TaxID=1246476 RepID=N1UYK2_9MICC|nr:ABC transporter substrate-binding protein [Arthrobacter crystallopoietes]EMY35471.1 substrate-binding region of ABC-type glycine betaine transport system [Arthrobacter crystallopoietes BAB-32]
MKNLSPARRSIITAAAASALALGLSACGANSNPLEEDTAGPAASPGVSGPLVVGSANFPESQVIGEIYAGALNAAGIEATTKPGIGSREVYVKAVEEGSVDVIPDYSGNLLLFLDPEATAASADEIMEALPAALPEGLSVLEPSPAENKDAMVVTKATAEKYQLSSIEDMGPVCDELVLGANPEFAERGYGLPGLKENYGCEPKSFEPINDAGGPATLKALITDQIQVADIYTTTPSIEDNDLVVLEDPKNNFIAQQVLPLVSSASVGEEATQVLNEVSAALTTEDLIDLNRQVSGDEKRNPADAAADWLKEKGLAE